MTTYTVGQVARLAGLTVRTMHHYDEIGLLTPSSRSDTGYRLYDEDDLERLRQILVYRELGIGLTAIGDLLDKEEPPGDRLLTERHRITERIRRLRTVSDMIDSMIESERKGMPMNASDALEVFGDFDPTEHEAEARQRWGNTDEYAQSARRTAAYTKHDWETIKAEASAIDDRFLVLMAEGVSADDPRTTEAVDAHRNHIAKWFYDCSPAVHAGLGQMYMQDHRFQENIDKAGDGLAAYISASIAARYRT